LNYVKTVPKGYRYGSLVPKGIGAVSYFPAACIKRLPAYRRYRKELGYMLSKETRIFASFHPDNIDIVQPRLELIKAAGWLSLDTAQENQNRAAVLEIIQQSGIVLIFLSKVYAQDERLMLEEFAYAATVTRRPFIPVWLDSLTDIQRDFQDIKCDKQLLSALEMLTAKNTGTTTQNVIAELEQFELCEVPYKPSTPQVCEKPCEAYEGEKPYIFMSYAHDDAPVVYPIIKELYESGWDLWYDEGIKTTERYLPVIAHNLKQCSAFVLMLTNRSLERPFVMNYEVEYARQLGIPIITVILEEIKPQPWSQENATRLKADAIQQDELLNRIGTTTLVNRRTRIAVPPAIKHNVIYDIAFQPELLGFRFTVRGKDITLSRYIGNETEVIIPETILSPDKSVRFKVTAIGEYAFTGGGGMASIHLPDEIKNSDTDAFTKCKAIKSIVIPNGVSVIEQGAFSGCESLINIAIPDSVTTIDDYAFQECTSINEITIPDSVISIGGWAFYGCTSLSSIVLPNNLDRIKDHTFTLCISLTGITIPNSVKSIDYNAFSNCASLKSIAIPNNVSYIGNEAFSNCDSLSEVILPDDIEDIGAGAFTKCPQLGVMLNASKTTLYRGPGKWDSNKPYFIPNGVTKICKGAFTSDIPLSSILYGDSAKTMAGMFKSESSLKEFFECDLPITDFFSKDKGSLYAEMLINTPPDFLQQKIQYLTQYWEGIRLKYKDYPPIERIIIPKSVREIDDEAFRDSKGLKSIIIPNSVTRIGKNAFWNCISLEEVIIPDSVTHIEKEAFRDCTSLKSITIPKSVVWMGDDVFMGCINLNIANESINKHQKDTIRENEPDYVEYQEDESYTVQPEKFMIPVCTETPRAKVCCATYDIHHVNKLLTELYWEGFNVFYNTSSLRKEIDESDCILAFISNDTESSEQAMNILKKAINKDVSHIVQVYLGDCNSLPEEISVKLHDRQAIIQKNLSDKEFSGRIRDSLRQFGCHIGHPRGFNVKNLGDAVEISKFNPTGFLQVIIPKTFLSPPVPVVEIGTIAFINCDSITSVIIPDGVKKINGSSFTGGAFFGCEALEYVEIPDSVTHIGANAFMGCVSLRSIKIPESVLTVGSDAFSMCKSLDNVIIPKSIQKIQESVFSYCESLKSVVISEGITHIGEFTFLACSSLESIVLPESLVSIDQNAFSNCESLKSIVIPENVKNIGCGAFYYCPSLKDVYIVSSDTSIDSRDYYRRILPTMDDELKEKTRRDIEQHIASEGDTSRETFDYCHKNLTFHTVPGGKAWIYAEKNNIKCSPIKKDAEFEKLREVVIPKNIMNSRDSVYYIDPGYVEDGDDLYSGEFIEYLNKVIECEEAYERDGTTEALWDVAVSSENMRKYLSELGEKEDALIFAENVVNAGIKLYEENGTAEDLTRLAGAYNQVCILLNDLSRTEEATAYYEKNVHTREMAHNKSDSMKTLSMLAASYADMKSHLIELGKNEEAITYANKAIEARKKVYEQERTDDALRKLARAYNNMAVLMSDLGRSEEADDHYYRSIDAREQLYGRSRTVETLSDLAGEYVRFLNHLVPLGETKKVLEICLKLIDTRKKEYEPTKNTKVQGYLRWAYTLMGDTLTKQGKIGEAEAYYDKVTMMQFKEGKNNFDKNIDFKLKKIEESDSIETLNELVKAYQNAGNQLTTQNKKEEAVSYYISAVCVLERIHELEKSLTSLNNLTKSYLDVGNRLTDLGRTDETCAYYEKALRVWEESELFINSIIHEQEKLYEQSKTNEVLDQLAFSYGRAGDYMLKVGQEENAGKFIRMLVNAREQLVKQDETPTRLNILALAYIKQGDLFTRSEQHKKAEDYYHKAIKIREQLINPEEKDLAMETDLRMAYKKMVECMTAQGNIDAAEMYNKKRKQLI